MLRRTFLAQFGLAIKQEGVDRAFGILRSAVKKEGVAAACAMVKSGSQIKMFDGGNADRVFLLASITKPMTATAVMSLVDQGQVKLTDPVRKYIPEFKGGDRDRVTVRMLLTHTSGLPDMLPENETLRARHAPLKEFVAGTCHVPLLFTPGTRCKYQSMGILLAAEISERVTQVPFRDFLRKTVFDPLGMSRTSLGLGGRKIADTAQSQVKGNDDWNWNSPYWRNLGAPWGGAHATAGDIIKFLDFFVHPDGRVIKPDTARTMITNQNMELNEPWGIGWRAAGFRIDMKLTDRAFGHGGSTGTTCWADPPSDTCFVLLTTKPAAESQKPVLTPVSHAVAEATS